MSNTTVQSKPNSSKDIQEVAKIVLSFAKMQVEHDDSETEIYDPMCIPYLCGKPGGGKTAILNDLFASQGWGVVGCHLALKSIEELSGIPNFKEIKDDDNPDNTYLGTEWSVPDIITAVQTEQKRLTENAKKLNNGKLPDDFRPYVALFLDDLHLAAPHHMALMFQLLTEKRIKDARLPKHTAIVLAGNHKSTKSGGRNMFAAIANRVVFLNVETSFDLWFDKFASKAGVHPSVIGFLRDGSNGDRFFHESELIDEAWASPRSWTYLSKFLNKCEENSNPLGISLLKYIANGIIGERATTPFLTFFELYSKFDMAKEFDKKEHIVIPKDKNESYAYVFAATLYYLKHYRTLKNERKYVNKDIVLGFAHILSQTIKSNKELVSTITAIIINDDKAFSEVATTLRTLPGCDKGLLSYFYAIQNVRNSNMDS